MNGSKVLEKKSKYLANLEKKKAEQKVISQLKDKSNNIESNHTNILTNIEDFYEHLYKKDTNLKDCENSIFYLMKQNKRAQRALGRSPEEKVKGHSGSNNREPQGHNWNNFG